MILQDFKFFCKQCPLAPDDKTSGMKRRVLNLTSAFLTILILLYRRLCNIIIHKNYKYTLGIVVIAKNESEYIQEWCAFHKVAGVDVIYLYDNESFDDMKEKLNPFINSGFVKYHYVKGDGKQMTTYNMALNTYKKECKYLAFIDCDEYLFSTNKNIRLKEDITNFFKHKLNAGGLAINWVMFGDNGHEHTPSGLCIEAFTKRATIGKRGTKLVKTVVCSERALYPESPHSFIYKWGFAAYDPDGNLSPSWNHSIQNYSSIHLNHYFCKSIEQWHKRRNLGDVGTPNRVRPLHDFFQHNNNDVEDTAILFYLPKVKQALETIQNIKTDKQ